LYVTNLAKQEGNAMKYRVLCFALWSAILALCFALPGAAWAAGAIWNNSTPPDISAWTGSGNTVTIEGEPSGALDVPPGTAVTIKGAAQTDGLALNIGPNAGVVWKADLTGSADGILISVSGEGAFEVNDGTIQVSGNDVRAIRVLSEECAVSVTGGLIKATGDINRAISCDTGVTMSGGTVEASGDGDVITIMAAEVAMSGGTVTASGNGSRAIFSNGDVTMSGGVIGASGNGNMAIYSNGDITMSGGTVEASGDDDVIAIMGAEVAISGGTVTASSNGSLAIFSKGNITMSDGVIGANGDGGFAVDGLNVIMNGGTVEATGNEGVAVFSPEVVTISGGMVDASGDGGCAISAVHATVSGGAVKAAGTGGTAIYCDEAGAYLVGAVLDGKLDAGETGLIVEADSLSIPASRHGESEGLTVREYGSNYTEAGAVEWDTSEGAGNAASIVFINSEVALDWGVVINDGSVDIGGSGGCSAANAMTANAGALGALTLAFGLMGARKRRKQK
jgi:hypothetical protein